MMSHFLCLFLVFCAQRRFFGILASVLSCSFFNRGPVVLWISVPAANVVETTHLFPILSAEGADLGHIQCSFDFVYWTSIISLCCL
ncbi:hypothetical protein C8J56DRAFT_574627 [Mycena floridula]|nr:hypothetical protein C8J56DRAFT_574627 [Mycena floridula]